MRKACAVCDFLSDSNKEEMRSVAAQCGFSMEFFESNEEAHGNVSEAEVAYIDDGVLLEEMPHLRWIHSVSAGIGHFLQSSGFDKNRITLTNSSGAYGLTISEHIIMVTLMLMRRIPEYLRVAEARGWERELAIRSIEDSVIAIVGTGNLGQNAAKRYKALGAKRVIGFSRSGKTRDYFDAVYKIEDFDSVIAGADEAPADVLVLCVPGTPDTEGLLSAERIALLPQKAFVINVGRGTVIDQDALIEALNSGRIAGAALDVMYPEPLPADHPLWEARNCIITPHVSGDMGLPKTVDITVDIFCDNLKRYASGGKLTHLVDINAGY